MNNYQRLVQAGLILPGASISGEDQQTINNLSSDEVTALINIKNQLGDAFLQRNARTIGIVF